MNVSPRAIVVACVCVIVLCFLGANALRELRADQTVHAGATSERALRAGDAPTQQRLDACATRPCIESWYERFSSERGGAAAIARLQVNIAQDQLGPADCHGVMHAIGTGSLEHAHGNAARAMSEGNADCASGYYHGVLGAAFVGRDVEDLPDFAAALCSADQFTTASGPIEQCAHGIGHGFMTFSGNDLPVALHNCERLDVGLVGSCAGGAFMENWSSIGTPAQSRWIRSDDVLYPCGVVAERYQFQCYSQLVGRMRAGDADWADISAACARVPDQFVDACYDSLGANAQSSTENDPVATAAICASAVSRDGGACVHGAAAAMVGYDGEVDHARTLCNTVASSLRASCAAGIGRSLANLPGRVGAADGCGTLARADARACLAAARTACRAGWARGAGCTASHLGLAGRVSAA